MGKVIMLRNVAEDFHRQVKMQAAAEGVSLQALVVKAIREYLLRAKVKGGGK
jgi:predicted HicB family RNase H-like nuclease